MCPIKLHVCSLNTNLRLDLRLGCGETEFRLKRKLKVFEALKDLLGEKRGPQEIDEVRTYCKYTCSEEEEHFL